MVQNPVNLFLFGGVNGNDDLINFMLPDDGKDVFKMAEVGKIFLERKPFFPVLR